MRHKQAAYSWVPCVRTFKKIPTAQYCIFLLPLFSFTSQIYYYQTPVHFKRRVNWKSSSPLISWLLSNWLINCSIQRIVMINKWWSISKLVLMKQF